MRVLPRQDDRSTAWRLLVCSLLLVCAGRPLLGDSAARDLPVATPTSAGTGGPATPEDRSLTLAEYIRLGVPAHDRLWLGDDVATALTALSEIARDGSGRLPRYRSERSGAAFARLTAAENLDFYRDRSLPLETRLPQAIVHLEKTNGITKLYLKGFLEKTTGGAELIELLGANFRQATIVGELVDEFFPSLPKDAPDLEVRKAGLKTMKRGMATMVAGGLTCLTEVESYTSEERKRLLGYLKETLPSIVPRLPPGSQAEIVVRIERLAKDPRLKDLQPGIDELLAAVRSAVEPAKGKDP